jgi:hypothetical protein
MPTLLRYDAYGLRAFVRDAYLAALPTLLPSADFCLKIFNPSHLAFAVPL